MRGFFRGERVFDHSQGMPGSQKNLVGFPKGGGRLPAVCSVLALGVGHPLQHGHSLPPQLWNHSWETDYLQMPDLQNILQLLADTGDWTVAYKGLQHDFHGVHGLQGGQRIREAFLSSFSPPGAD